MKKLDVRVSDELVAEIKQLETLAGFSTVVRRLIEIGLDTVKTSPELLNKKRNS